MLRYDNLDTFSLLRQAGTALAVVLLAGLLVTPAQAQTEKQSVNGRSGGKMTDETEAVAHAALAYDLARYGVDARDAMSLVNAANILIRENVQPHDQAEVDSEEGDQGEDDKERPPVPRTPEELLAAAEQMSGGDEAVAAAVSAARSALEEGEDRGRVGGPGSLVTRVSARSTDRVSLGDFRGGEYGRVEVRGDGDTDLDCFLYDENDNLIDSDTDYTDVCVLTFRPRWTGPFRLEVRNLGSVWNEYSIVTN